MTASALARNGGPGHLISSTPSPPIQSPGHPSKNATDAPLPAQIRPQIRQRNQRTYLYSASVEGRSFARRRNRATASAVGRQALAIDRQDTHGRIPPEKDGC